ncbi:MAG: HzsA-related protein, partial [Planctomycetota bacterium]
TEGEATPFVWTERSTFHIFKVNVDGSDLVQLTDGPVNDFDPCWLPGKRIVFISERRGGYGRCHPRPVPLYTLHSMNSAGGNIVRLSHHEANEWHPSVNHDGMIVYTRWDYTDRGNIQAHHPWITTPDGRDARAIQGNYGKSRQARPIMEMDVKAIPDSRKYVATAAAHHSQAYGSLVLIDPRVEDDDAMSAVRRLTPDAPFPEAEVGWNEGQLYATAWPLSEYFYLCVYDAEGSGRRGMSNNYGIYLVDAFGNKELVYRDPEISCLSPIPMRSRKAEPVLADMVGGDETPEDTGMATVGLINVYNSLKPFPEGTVIKALRIIQVLPKTTPLINEPRIGYGNEKGARAVLGTVPVEADGSAYFEMPPDKLVYFQALNERGLAVQSMRSDAYVHPGERLICHGCHEPRHSTPGIRQRFADAFQRAPSKIRPDVDGSNPFSFPRLVQPVLERNCVACHEKEHEAPDLGKGDWEKDANYRYASYMNLREFAFFYGAVRNKYDPWSEPRTEPGRFGARTSKLFDILEKGHYDLELSREDLHRITLWLDCNSDYFGAYEDAKAQARGDIVRPELE